jgi:hypothetical protein
MLWARSLSIRGRRILILNLNFNDLLAVFGADDRRSKEHPKL